MILDLTNKIYMQIEQFDTGLKGQENVEKLVITPNENYKFKKLICLSTSKIFYINILHKKITMSFAEIKKFLQKMQTDESLKNKVISSATADDVALIAQELGFSFSGDDLLRFNGQKVDKVTVRKVQHPGEYH